MYTYDIRDDKAIIRYANGNDIHENLFDDLKGLKEQLTEEGFDIQYELTNAKEGNFFMWLELGTREEIEDYYFLPEDRTKVLVDEYNRPYEQTPNGKLYCSSKKNYEYSVEN